MNGVMGAVKVTGQLVGYLVGAVLPSLDNGGRTLLVGNQAVVVVGGNLVHPLLGLVQVLLLLLRDQGVHNGYGGAGNGGILIALRLQSVQHLGCHGNAVHANALLDDLAQLLLLYNKADLRYKLILRIGTIHKTQVLRHRGVKDHTTDGRLNQVLVHFPVHFLGEADQALGVQAQRAFLVGHHGLVLISVNIIAGIFVALGVFLHRGAARLAALNHGQVIGTDHHILGRHGYRLTVRGFQQVVSSQHQHSGLCLCLCGKGHVHSHLVAVEVCVKCGTSQRVQLNCATLYQHRLKSLNTQTVQGRCTVKHHRVILNDHFQRVPNGRVVGTLHHLTGRFNVRGHAGLYQPLHHKGLKQLDRHFLRQTALVHLQFRANHDYGTAGVVDTLTQQVLTEATLLTFQHIGQGLQRTVVGAGDRTAAAAVVDQGVHRLLEHTLFVAHDNIRCAQLQQLLQTVVSVDNAAIQVVQIRGGKTAAVQLNHGANIRGDYRDGIQDHPLQLIAALIECIDHIQALEQTHTLLTGSSLQLLGQLIPQGFHINVLQQLFDGLGAHAGLKVVLIALAHFCIFFFVKDLHFLQRGVAGIRYDIQCKVQHLLQITGAQIQYQPKAAGNALKIPNVRHGSRKFNVTHTLTAHLGPGDLYAAALADLALIAYSLIFAAVALPVLHGAENALAEQTVPLRLQRSVIDGLRLGDLAVGPLPNLLGRRQTDFDRAEFVFFILHHGSTPLYIM